jgi:nitroimidazol reductase NimA-like FMN-containing flavoprotein (pyridoxamine 5'-phosphate oxidase superfamily)
MESLAALSREECLRGLASHSLGRLALTAHALPVIVPICYSFSDGQIVFRAPVDGMVARACDGSVVAFQVDNLGRDVGTEWSVLVVGLAALIAGTDTLRSLPIPAVSGPGGGPDQFVRITIGQISGSPIRSSGSLEAQPVE